jgi:cell division protein DivIC
LKVASGRIAVNFWRERNSPAKIRFRRRGARVLLAGMNVDLGIWSKLTKVVVGLIVLAVLLLMGRCYLPLIQQNERMRREISRLDVQLQNEEAKSKQLKAEIDALRNDPKTVERLMREKLGYAKPDETVVRFEPATTNSLPR